MGTVQRLPRLLGRRLLFLLLFVFRLPGGLLPVKGIDLLTLQERRDDHRENDGHDESGIDPLRLAVGDGQGQQAQRAQPQAEVQADLSPTVWGARQPQPSRQPVQRASGRGQSRAVKVGEIRLDVGLDPFAVLLLGVFHVQGHPQRKPVAVNPDLASTDGVAVLIRDAQRQSAGKFAPFAQRVFQLVADVGCNIGAVEVESVMRGAYCVLRSFHLVHVSRPGQVGQQVVAGGKGAGKIVNLLPRTADLATVSLVAFDAHFDAVARFHHAAAVLPQHHLQSAFRQICLAFEIDAPLTAAAADIGQGWGGMRGLDNHGAKVVHARFLHPPPGGVQGIGGGRRRGSGHRVNQQRQGQAQCQQHDQRYATVFSFPLPGFHNSNYSRVGDSPIYHFPIY